MRRATRCCAISAPARIPRRKSRIAGFARAAGLRRRPRRRAGALLKARFVVAGSRLYQIAYVGARDGLAMADIDMFLTSFKLLR